MPSRGKLSPPSVEEETVVAEAPKLSAEQLPVWLGGGGMKREGPPGCKCRCTGTKEGFYQDAQIPGALRVGDCGGIASLARKPGRSVCIRPSMVLFFGSDCF